MTKIDDILDRLQHEQPVIDAPEELTERIMNSLPERGAKADKARTVRLWWRWTAAACLLALVGVGGALLFPNEEVATQPVALQQETPKVETADTVSKSNTEEKTYIAEAQTAESPKAKRTEPKAEMEQSVAEENTVAAEPQPIPVLDSNLHYASLEVADSAYQAPSRMEEFIAKLAEYNKVKAVPLNCSSDKGPDSTIVSTACVFEDKEELNLFGRLLQAACWYDSKTPGYLLNFSHQQFVFCLEDLHKGEKYLWIAERLSGNYILLFSTHSPKQTVVSSACFQDYREQLTHKGINMLNF